MGIKRKRGSEVKRDEIGRQQQDKRNDRNSMVRVMAQVPTCVAHAPVSDAVADAVELGVWVCVPVAEAVDVELPLTVLLAV